MTLNAELYRNARAQLREWSEVKARRRRQEMSELGPGERWRRYVEVTELCLTLSPSASTRHRRDKLSSVDHYYAAVQRMEAKRRQARGRSP
jgi:hypothetical protein